MMLAIVVLLSVSTASVYCKGISRHHQGYVQALSYSARLIVNPLNATVVEVDGAKISFFCQADGNPLPTITWTRNGKSLSKSRYVVEQEKVGGLSTLRIEPLRDSDNESEITCSADNGVGRPAQASAWLTVLRNGTAPAGFPRIEIHPRLKAVEKGRVTDMTCTVYGDPRPSILWLRDLFPIDVHNNPRYSIATLGNPGALMIQHSSELDEGKYECVARSSKGVVHSKSAHLYVKVRRVPPHFSIPPEPVYKVTQNGKVNLTCVAVGYPMPQVFWRRGYHISVTDDISNAPIGKNVLVLDDVKESDNYTCVAMSKLGNIEATARVVVKALPVAVSNLRVSNVTSASVALLWDAISSSKEESIKHYIVLYRPKNTSDLPTDAPLKLQARPLGPHSVVVHWEPPEMPNGEITEYRVIYSLNAGDPVGIWQEKLDKGAGRTVTIGSMQTGAHYYLRVQAANRQGYGPLSNPITVITKPGVPGQPQGVKVQPSSPTKMRISWDEPLFSSKAIGYVVLYNQSAEFSRIETDASSINELTVHDLKPDTWYSFKVAAKSVKGEGAFSNPISAKTSPSVPSGSPVITSLSVTDKTSINVEWNPPPKDTHNGALMNYRVSWTHVPDIAHVSDYVDSDSADFSGTHVVSVNKPRKYRIEGLQTYSEYIITVAAGTEEGFGPNSHAKTVTTDEDDGHNDQFLVPTAPQNVRVEAVNATAVKLSWTRPERANGIHLGYLIFQQKLKNGEPIAPTFRQILRINSPAIYSTIVGGLEPNTEYSFQITAFNKMGDGQFSEAKKFFTRGLPPSLPVKFLVNLADDGWARKGPLVAHLVWSPPESSSSPIKGYKIRYKSEDMIVFNTRQTVHTTYDVNDLFPGRMYEFYLSAENEDGYSEEVREALQTPVSKPEAEPMNVRYEISSGGSALDITWDPPPVDQRNGEIMRYQVKLTNDMMETPVEQTVELPSKRAQFLISKNRKYYVTVAACTSVGCGPYSQKIRIDPSSINTLDPPFDVRVQAIGEGEVAVTWQYDTYNQVDGYVVRYTDEPRSKEDQNNWKQESIKSRRSKSLVIGGLKRDTPYAFCVAAMHESLTGVCSAIVVLDSIIAQHIVRNLRVIEEKKRSITIKWDYTGPGPAAFYISYTAHKNFTDQKGEPKSWSFSNSFDNLQKDSFTLDKIRPATNYSFKVGVMMHSTKYWPSHIKASTLYDVPPFVEMPEVAKHQKAGPKQITLIVKPTSEEYGRMSYYWIVVGRLGDKLTPLANDSALSMNALQSANDKSVAYVTANITAQHLISVMRNEGGLITIGKGININGFHDYPLDPNTHYKAFLRAFVSDRPSPQRRNRRSDSLKFKPVRKSENPLYADSNWTQKFKGQPVMEASGALRPKSHVWLVGPIVAILIITLIVGMLIIWWMKRKGKKNALPMKLGSISKVTLGGPTGPTETSKLLVQDNYPPATTTLLSPYDPIMVDSIPGGNMEMRQINPYSSLPQTPGMNLHPPIPITELANHIDRLKLNDSVLFSQEYESIETGQQFTWTHSNADYNKAKNRYANVIAYDHSRVVLSGVEGVAGSDYINANYIDGYRKPKAYIATQGPLPETFADFWRMVWEENSVIIVMLTKLEERTRVKCDQYWPSRGSQAYGNVIVSLVDSFELAHYTIRTLRIQRRGDLEQRDIRLMQFTAWPDHGVPDHPTPFLMFLKRVKALQPPDAGPIITHCSAGVGRTGTFIVIDCMLDRLRFENTVDIYGCVTCIRSQRNYMVQTEDQYVFIHDAVLDAVQSGSTEVPAPKLYTHIQALLQLQPLDNASGMELEFRHLAALKMPCARFVSANQPCNKQKNRLVNILPYDMTRVCLLPLAGADGSDYINASWVDGYRMRNAYIATQGPLPNTADDFWRLLWEHNSCIIVMLTKLREMGREKCFQYWPSETSEQYGELVVEPIAEYNMDQYQYVLREFKVTSTQTGETRTVRHFQYGDWPEQGVPKSGEGFVEFIGQIHTTKEQFGLDGPVTVHCSAGVGRTGVFIGLSIVLERMRFENVVDIFTTVKLLRTQRPNMVQSEDQYHFCYQAALEYLGNFNDFIHS